MLLLALAAGCPKPTSGTEPQVEAPAIQGSVRRLPIPGLVDVACDASGCAILDANGLRDRDGQPVALPPGPRWTGLSEGPGGLEVHGVTESGACVWTIGVASCAPVAAPAPDPVGEPPPPVDQARRFEAQWNAARAAAGRLPFASSVPAAGGGVLTLLRGVDGRGQIFRSGGGAGVIPVPVTPSPATWPAPFALHPSGQELYLLPWPTGSVRALDRTTLGTRWTVSLDGAGQGLFVDADGRFLLALVGAPDLDQFSDWPVRQPPPDAPCCADEALRGESRPPAEAVVVVDLVEHRVALRVEGRYRRWEREGEVAWLATDRELARLTVAPPEVDPR